MLRTALAAVLAALAVASPSWAQLDAVAQRSYADYERLAPHRAFATSVDGKGYYWTGAGGAEPAGAVDSVLKACETRSESTCTLYAVNNVILDGRDWKTAMPALLGPIGRLRPQPWWQNKGPQAAAGLIVWSHGYRAGKDNTIAAPQGQVARFTVVGYDLYRFDRERIRNRTSDAVELAEAVRQARSMGYRKVVLAGQSAGAWVSLAAAANGAPVDGVIAAAAAHHGMVKTMRDVSVARSDWQQLVQGIKPGPRLVVVNFADDAYDVGGRMDDARSAFASSGVQALVIDEPEGFKGHGAAVGNTFPRKFGACIAIFIESGTRQAPCI